MSTWYHSWVYDVLGPLFLTPFGQDILRLPVSQAYKVNVGVKPSRRLTSRGRPRRQVRLGSVWDVRLRTEVALAFLVRVSPRSVFGGWLSPVTRSVFEPLLKKGNLRTTRVVSICPLNRWAVVLLWCDGLRPEEALVSEDMWKGCLDVRLFVPTINESLM